MPCAPRGRIRGRLITGSILVKSVTDDGYGVGRGRSSSGRLVRRFCRRMRMGGSNYGWICSSRDIFGGIWVG